MMETNFKNFELLVARAVVMSGDVVPTCLLKRILRSYSICNVFALLEIMEVMNGHLEEFDTVEDTVMESAVYVAIMDAPFQKRLMLMELVKETLHYLVITRTSCSHC